MKTFDEMTRDWAVKRIESLEAEQDEALKRLQNQHAELARLRERVAKALKVLGECETPCGYMLEMAEALRGE